MLVQILELTIRFFNTLYNYIVDMSVECSAAISLIAITALISEPYHIGELLNFQRSLSGLQAFCS